jgi:hypothetical protein
MDGSHQLYTAIVPATITTAGNGMEDMMGDILRHALDNTDHIISHIFKIVMDRREAKVFMQATDLCLNSL